MSKYYIQSGKLQFLTVADDAQTAALTALHQYISTRVDIDTIDWSAPETIDRLDLISVILDLNDLVMVSQIGFGRDEAGVFDTADVLTEWNQLLIAVSRLETILGHYA